MFNIDKYLEKFSKNIVSLEKNKKQILDIIEKNTGIHLSSEEIQIKDFCVYLQSSPAVKNKIFINKTKILKEIEESGKFKIKDIK